MSSGSMSDHLKRYRDYVGDLKAGQSSGISAAFGRASDLLPADVMEIKKAAPAATPPPPPVQLNREYLRQAVETMVSDVDNRKSETALAVSASSDDPVGTKVRTEGGSEEEVLSFYVENGQRMFMLSDLSTIDEETFERDKISRPPSAEATPATESVTAQAQKISEQAVSTPEGMLLWLTYYGKDGPALISMSDGGIIKRAEGQRDYILSRLSATTGDIQFFILSGLVVDPATGNIYIEANQGAYSAAFLNSGFQIHQYRNHSGEESFYVTEPLRPDRAPLTVQVRNLKLNMDNGEVTYETMDSSVSITLKSREL